MTRWSLCLSEWRETGKAHFDAEAAPFFTGVDFTGVTAGVDLVLDGVAFAGVAAAFVRDGLDGVDGLLRCLVTCA
jgi:hypothetical protein